MRARQVREPVFPSGVGTPIAVVNVPAEALATKLGFELNRWDEDGLGEATGFAFSVDDHLFLVRELPHALERLGAHGPDIQADLADLRRRGIPELLNTALAALGLSRNNATWVAEGLPRG